MVADLLLVLLLAGGFLLGFLRGSVRQLLSIAAWFVAFLLSAHLAAPLGNWLHAELPEFSFSYTFMLSFGLLFLLLFGLAFALIQLTGASLTLTRHEVLDELVGALFGIVVVVLIVTAALVILDTYYGLDEASAGDTIGWLGDIRALLDGSAIVAALRTTVIPLLGQMLAPLLPPDVRTVMG